MLSSIIPSPWRKKDLAPSHLTEKTLVATTPLGATPNMTRHIPNGGAGVASQQGEGEILFDTSESTSESGEASDSHSASESESESEDEDRAAEAQLQESQSQWLVGESDDEHVSDSEEEAVAKVTVASPSLSSPTLTTKSKAAMALEKTMKQGGKRKRESSPVQEEERIVDATNRVARSRGKKRLAETQPKVLERNFLSASRAEAVKESTVKNVKDSSPPRKRKRGQAKVSEEYVLEEDEEEDQHLRSGSKSVSRSPQPQTQQKTVDSLLAAMRDPTPDAAPGDEDTSSSGEDSIREAAPPSSKQPRKRARKTTQTTLTNGVVSSIETSLPSPANTTSSPPSSCKDPSSQIAQRNSKNRYSADEKSRLDSFRDTYCRNHQIPRGTFNSYVQSTQPGDAIEGKVKTDFWAEIKAVLPHRDPFSLQRYMRRTYHELNVGRWTKEDELELHRLAAQHGRKWKLIAEEMERITDDVIGRYRNHVANLGKQKTSRWEKSEVDALIEAVTSLLAMRELYDGDLRALLLQEERPDVSWSQASQLMHGKRSGQQCAAKWERLKSKAREAESDAELDLTTPGKRSSTTRRGGRNQSRKGNNKIASYLSKERLDDTDDPIEDDEVDSGGEEGSDVRSKLRERKIQNKILDPVQDDEDEDEDEDENQDDEDGGNGSESESESESDAVPGAKPATTANDETSSEDENSGEDDENSGSGDDSGSEDDDEDSD